MVKFLAQGLLNPLPCIGREGLVIENILQGVFRRGERVQEQQLPARLAAHAADAQVESQREFFRAGQFPIERFGDQAGGFFAGKHDPLSITQDT